MYNKKAISWAFYDWANSVFFTTVMAGFFPVFFKKYWSTPEESIQSTARLGIILAIAGFALAALSPLLGVVSDRYKAKKKFLFLFMSIGALATTGLYTVQQGDWLSAALYYGIAFFCASGSVVFNDALIVSVTEPRHYDRVSSLGYSLGYLGGGLLFIVNVLMFQKPELFGLTSGVEGVKYSFLTVAVWWFIFSLPTFLNVPEPEVILQRESLGDAVKKTLAELKQTALALFAQKNLKYFLIAYWFYIDGVATVMSMAVDFGISIGFDSSDLIKALILTQFVGFPAAYFTGYLSDKFNNRIVILGCLLIYVAVVFGAAFMSQSYHFYIMAGLIGLAQGGVQALSRSLFASLIPEEKSGEYFGFYNLLGKFASVLGPLLMSVTAFVFQKPQMNILSLLVLFVVGIYFLLKVNLEKCEDVKSH